MDRSRLSPLLVLCWILGVSVLGASCATDEQLPEFTGVASTIPSVSVDATSTSETGEPQTRMEALFPGSTLDARLARLALISNEPQRAIDAARDMLAADATDVDGLMLLAAGQFQRGEVDAALETSQLLTGVAPDDPEAWFVRAIIASGNADAGLVSFAFDQARRLAPDFALAQVIDALGRLREAGVSAEQVDPIATDLDRTARMAILFGWHSVLASSGPPETVERSIAALFGEPGEATVGELLGPLEESAGEGDQVALVAWSIAQGDVLEDDVAGVGTIESVPALASSFMGQISLGERLEAAGRSRDALAAFETSLELNPTNAAAASLAAQLADPLDAPEYWQLAALADPSVAEYEAQRALSLIDGYRSINPTPGSATPAELAPVSDWLELAVDAAERAVAAEPSVEHAELLAIAAYNQAAFEVDNGSERRLLLQEALGAIRDADALAPESAVVNAATALAYFDAAELDASWDGHPEAGAYAVSVEALGFDLAGAAASFDEARLIYVRSLAPLRLAQLQPNRSEELIAVADLGTAAERLSEVDTLVLFAELALVNGDFDAAVSAAQGALGLVGELPEAFTILGRAYVGLGSCDLAGAAFDVAVDLGELNGLATLDGSTCDVAGVIDAG